jgi:hypothetical protein
MSSWRGTHLNENHRDNFTFLPLHGIVFPLAENEVHTLTH